MSMKTTMLNQTGQVAVEFALATPVLALFVLTFLAISAMCIRGEVASLASIEAARAAGVYRQEAVANRLRSANHPQVLSNAMSLRFISSQGGERGRNWDDSFAMVVDHNNRPYFGITNVKGGIRRASPATSALIPDLSDGILNGGDSPSPYCRCMEGYCLCGFGH